MRLMGLQKLQPGMQLAVPVLTSGGKIVLNEGVMLTEAYISKFEELGMKKIYIQDERFEDVDIPLFLDVQLMNRAAQVLYELHDSVHRDKPLDEYAVKNAAQGIVEYARANKQNGVSLISSEVLDDYVIHHSIHTAVLTAFMGNVTDLNYIQLCDLVTGALIHDIGRENTGVENPEHTQKGFDAMRKCRGLSLHSSIVCYEHHENLNGSGYPRKLKGSAISLFSRMIQVADVYDTLLHGYEDNKPLMPDAALQQLVHMAGTILDAEIVQMFNHVIVLFPNGCTVLLSNNLRAVVVRQNPDTPQKPVVRVVTDTSVLGDIDLSKTPAIFIKEIIE